MTSAHLLKQSSQVSIWSNSSRVKTRSSRITISRSHSSDTWSVCTAGGRYRRDGQALLKDAKPGRSLCRSTQKHCYTDNMESTITCPQCGHQEKETIPTNQCVFFYKCERCGTILRPQPGDCCVFCSYGSTKCPTADRRPA